MIEVNVTYSRDPAAWLAVLELVVSYIDQDDAADQGCDRDATQTPLREGAMVLQPAA